jgi:hypothetical protein
MNKLFVVIATLLAASSTHAACSNPLTSLHSATHLVAAENGKGL